MHTNSPEFMPERRLWAAVVQYAVMDLNQTGHRGHTAEAFFHSRNGMFDKLCSFLNLPQDLIEEEVARRLEVNFRRKLQ